MSVFDGVAEKKQIVTRRLECLKNVEWNLKLYQLVRKFPGQENFLKELREWAQVWGKRSEELKEQIKQL